jgi:K+-sensing histidine kinase KdpD
VLFDDQGRVVCLNRAAAELAEVSPAESVGLGRGDWNERISRCLTPLRESAVGEADQCAGERLESRGFPRRVLLRKCSPVGPAGAETGTLETLTDITAQARWEQEVIRDRERHRRERERLETQLEQIEKYKMELTANVTHDLRTPLASIKASVSGLLAGDVAYDPQTLRETLTLIEEETDRLQRRVQNLLSMSKMESGDALLNRDWADPTDIAATALESLRSIQSDRQVRLEFQPDLPLVLADYDQLLIAVRNLLENAFLYSPAESPIELSVSASLGQIRFRVRDYGAGLMPDEFERIFDKFYRGRSARRIPGTGLGLPICRGIAEAHGGRLWAEHAPDGGVAFVLSIPYESAAAELESELSSGA